MGSGALLAACKTHSSQIGFEELYGGSARRDERDRNPIIVIPGILGSRLRDEDTGEIVWGVLGGLGGRKRPRQLALPMAEGTDLALLRDRLVADEVLDRIEVHAGVSISVKAYAQLLAALGAGGYRDQSLGESGAVDYGDGHFTCFQFPYDWRRPCAENAVALAAFIEEKRRYVAAERRKRYGATGPVRFDLVAHSMGGLVVRHYLGYGDDGGEGIDKVVLVAPPNGGSVSAFRELIDGYRPGPLVESFPAAVLGTLPSPYELLPRPRHGAIRDERGNPVDHFDPEVWIRGGWGLAAHGNDEILAELLPEVNDAGRRRAIALDHLAKCLASARRVHAELDRPLAPALAGKIHLFAGDRFRTPSRATVSADGRVRILEHASGDETVTRASALLDERNDPAGSRLESPLSWAQTTFIGANHLGLTKDPTFIDNLLHLLLET